jgi:glycosyltransferase involved in cell wall biosynthesis
MKRTLTIVHTEASVSWGGQGLRILRESLWMRDRGHRLVIIAPGQSRIIAEAQRAGLETYVVRFARQTQVRDLFKLGRHLQRIAPDILNTHSSIDTWVGCLAGRLCHVPVIIRTRHLGAPVRTHLFNRWLYRSLCHHIFTTGDGIARALIAGLGLAPARVSTIPTGIDPPTVLPDRDAARRSFVKELALSPDARFIGCLAVLREGKGHTVLLEAFRRIQTRVPHYHLLIVGDGASRQQLQALIEAWGLQQRVHLTGYRPDPWLVLRALDIHVLASISIEGIPQAVLQAQYAGCPVVGSNCGGIAEVITHAETGLLVPKGEAEALAQALLRLLEDRDYAAWLARNASQQMEARHTIDGMGQQILAIYHQLLDGRA